MEKQHLWVWVNMLTMVFVIVVVLVHVVLLQRFFKRESKHESNPDSELKG
jgi:heme/copper-type cytochrome/quinol oxidase subunit 2